MLVLAIASVAWLVILTLGAWAVRRQVQAHLELRQAVRHLAAKHQTLVQRLTTAIDSVDTRTDSSAHVGVEDSPFALSERIDRPGQGYGVWVRASHLPRGLEFRVHTGRHGMECVVLNRYARVLDVEVGKGFPPAWQDEGRDQGVDWYPAPAAC